MNTNWLFWEIDGFTERMNEKDRFSYHIRCLPKTTEKRLKDKKPWDDHPKMGMNAAEQHANHLADTVDHQFEMVAKIKRLVRRKDDIHNTLLNIDEVCDRILKGLFA